MDYYYPEIEPFQTHFLQVSDLHTIYVEQCGNPEGKPVLVVHGGPGGGICPEYRRFFHPEKYHIILVDQRGSGKSTPHAELEENNTQNLVDDFETVRRELNIEKWMLFGGSWGSTLSLVYAQAHPGYVTELVLRGIYLATEKANQWLFGGKGANEVFPDFWEKFIEFIPKEEHNDLLNAYYKRLTSDNEQERVQAARAWAGWEMSIIKLIHDPELLQEALDSPVAMSLARFECHYMKNLCFLKPNQLLSNINKIKHIPGFIVHGRYDMACASSNAWELHKAWPESQLHYVADAGHSCMDPPLAKKLIEICDQLADL